jgi:hypothetical protein
MPDSGKSNSVAEVHLHIGSFSRIRILLEPYPFSVVYVIRGDEVVIIAVAHHKRRPGYWAIDTVEQPLAADGGWCDSEPSRLKRHVSRTQTTSERI